ncbi:LOW QUALITY PROTEIN: hypothetical protein Nmel_016469 [Mimus melanotis]
MQQGSNLLLFVKTWSCGDQEQGGAATKLHFCSFTTGLFYRSDSLVYPVTSREVPEFLRKKKLTQSNVEKVPLEQTFDAITQCPLITSVALGLIQMHILGVYDQAGCSQGCVCAIELSCCPVFDGNPQSWMVLATDRKGSGGTGTGHQPKD